MRICTGLLLAVVAAAQAPLEGPMLRIETGMHTAKISDIAVDAAERFLVTGSDDKTVRVWELPTGRLLRTIRPPAGTGDEGKIYAAAISPDGKTIAAGGWTGYEWDNSSSVYLFDRESGTLRRRLAGLPSAITHLAFSPDGRLLVATVGDKGIRLYDTADYSSAGTDAGYGGGSYGAAFSPDSRQLVATSYDGLIRLYDVSAGLRLLRKEKAPGGAQPRGVAFAPGGTRIAVGYRDVPRVDVLAAENLSLLFSRTVANGNLLSVAWSRDGAYLLAGGTYDLGGGNPIVRWNGDGGGERQFTAAGNTIAGMIPLRDGGLVMGSTDPGFGILDRDGNRFLWRGPPIADLRGPSSLYASADGLRVGFRYEVRAGSSALFSTGDRSLSPGELSSSLSGPLTTGLDVTEWRNSTAPTLGGSPLKLAQNEMSRSLAIAPDRQSFALATDWLLRLFDRSGRLRWIVPAPSTAWAVNIPRDGRMVIAAFGDGTIRWYRIEDGKELLAFFPAADRKNWVLWTPSGYYDASPGGEDLIGWHVSNGHEAAADFYPGSRFRSVRYRPDVVGRVLSALDENEALRLADAEKGARPRPETIAQMLPPTVRILSPEDGATVSTSEVTVRYAAGSANGEPITGIRVLVDGRPVEAVRGLVRVGGQQVQVTIPKQDSEVSIIAENRFAASVPDTIRLRWAAPAGPGTGTAGAQPFVIKPKLYVLAVGISAYAPPNTLQLSAKDARSFAASISAQKGLLYRDVETRLLIDAQATRDAILDGLDWLEKSTTQHDVAIVFFSGHGVNDANGIYYFLPQRFDVERLKRTAVAESDIRNTVQALAGKVLVFVDSCHAGNAMGGRARGIGNDVNAVANELASAENGAVVFTASTGRQEALERADWGNGAFTKAVIEGLNGKADLQNTGRITINMLDLYVSERVKELTGGRQTPTTTKPQTIADFPIAVRR